MGYLWLIYILSLSYHCFILHSNLEQIFNYYHQILQFMASMNGNMGFIGSMGNISAYKMLGSDKIIIRTKGGAKKDKIKRSPKFALTRENNSEFGGCAKMSKSIRAAIYPICHLADYNFTSAITSIVKKIQLQDVAHKRGERAVYLSQYRYLLDGFSLNKNTSFDAIIRHSFHPQLNKEDGSVTVELPALIPGVNLNLPWPQPVYRLVFSIGVVNDLEYGAMGFNPPSQSNNFTNQAYTPWQPSKQIQAAQTINLQLQGFEPLTDNQSIIIAAGIEMGAQHTMSEIHFVKYCGNAKILLVG